MTVLRAECQVCQSHTYTPPFELKTDGCVRVCAQSSKVTVINGCMVSGPMTENRDIVDDGHAVDNRNAVGNDTQ